MNLVEKQIISKNDKRYSELMSLCHLSKNLYNSVLYTIRQHWFETVNDDTVEHKFLNYYDVYHKMVEDKNPDFYALQYHSAQLVIKDVESNFASFFGLLKLKKQGKYDKKVKLPKYLPKDGYHVLKFDTINKREFKKTGYIKLPKTNLKFKTKQKNIKFVSITPKNDYVVIAFMSKVNEKPSKKDNGRYFAIDIGINNLATVSSNFEKPFIIDGKKVKHINQFYNKKISEVKSELKKKNNKEYSHRTRQLTLKRNNKIEDYFHKASRYIINQAVSKNVSTIIVGHNKNWKQEVNMGTSNNQKFVQIPFDKLIWNLKYKGRLEGIQVVEIEEGYTSKCSALDNESIEKHEEYLGKRVKRGLFKTKTGILVNADINGSLNIMRKFKKCNCDVLFKDQQMQGLVLNPVKVKFN